MQGAKTVDQALSVLLAIEGHARTASDLSEVTGLNRTVVHRMLAALHARGFVRREGDRYLPGAVFVRFATTVEPTLRTASRQVMRELTAATGETTVLSVVDHLDAVAIEQVAGRAHPLRVEYEIGSRRPVVKGASGRSLLAFLDDGVVFRAQRSVADAEALRTALDEVREKGFAVSHDELRNGISGIAGPVFSSGRVVASLSVIAPTQRSAQLLEHVDVLLRATATISENLERAARGADLLSKGASSPESLGND